MKLTELDPRWAVDADIIIGDVVVHDDNRVGMGLSFKCPHCKQTRLGIFFSNPVDGKPPSDDYDVNHLWHRDGDTFENLTLSPSINASASSHWHGCITNGEIK